MYGLLIRNLFEFLRAVCTDQEFQLIRRVECIFEDVPANDDETSIDRIEIHRLYPESVIPKVARRACHMLAIDKSGN